MFIVIKELEPISRPMKRIVLVATAACGIAVALNAQEAPLPQGDAQNPAATDARAPTPAPSVPAPIAIPEDLLREPIARPPLVPDVPSIPELNDSFKPAPLSAAAQLRQLTIDSRKLRNRVQIDPQIKAALAHAEAAPTDLEKRQRLAKYYDVYYGRMIALAGTPELKTFLRERRLEYLLALKQPRVRPELLASVKQPDPAARKPAASTSPSPTASASAAPSPAPAAVSEPALTLPFASPGPRAP
jgi:hypothetical protein